MIIRNMVKMRKIADLTAEEMVLHFSKFFTSKIFKIAVRSLITEGVYPDETEKYQNELKHQIMEIKRAKGND